MCISLSSMLSESFSTCMARPRRPAIRYVLALVVVLASLSACVHPSKHTDSNPSSDETGVADSRDSALALLDYAHHLAVISPDGREAVVHAARDQVSEQPTALHYAHLALALGTPGQRLYTPDEAARYARLALQAKPAPWSTAARQYLEDYARLYTELTGDNDSGGSPARVAQLKKELAEAHKKLRALAHIEERLDSADGAQ